MSKESAELSERARILAKAVSRWDNEGGAGDGGRVYPQSDALLTDTLQQTNAELAHMQVRVIAIENLLKVLLVDASKQQVALMRDVATFISPRSGYTQHPRSIHAAACMNNFIDNAGHLRALASGPSTIDTAPL